MRDKLGRFIKGHIQLTNKGSFKKGHIPISPFKKGHIPWMKGKKHNKKSKEKIGFASKGRRYSNEINKKKGSPREKNSNWKGGKYKSPRGYIYILMPEHPYCKKSGYVKRATLVMEKHLGRYLIPPEIVHHKKAPDNDKIKYLQLCANQGEHRKLYSTR